MKEKMAQFQPQNAWQKEINVCKGFVDVMCGCYLKVLIFLMLTLLLLNMVNMAELTEEHFWRQFMGA